MDVTAAAVNYQALFTAYLVLLIVFGVIAFACLAILLLTIPELLLPYFYVDGAVLLATSLVQISVGLLLIALDRNKPCVNNCCGGREKLTNKLKTVIFPVSLTLFVAMWIGLLAVPHNNVAQLRQGLQDEVDRNESNGLLQMAHSASNCCGIDSQFSCSSNYPPIINAILPSSSDHDGVAGVDNNDDNSNKIQQLAISNNNYYSSSDNNSSNSSSISNIDKYYYLCPIGSNLCQLGCLNVIWQTMIMPYRPIEMALGLFGLLLLAVFPLTYAISRCRLYWCPLVERPSSASSASSASSDDAAVAAGSNNNMFALVEQSSSSSPLASIVEHRHQHQLKQQQHQQYKEPQAAFIVEMDDMPLMYAHANHHHHHHHQPPNQFNPVLSSLLPMAIQPPGDDQHQHQNNNNNNNRSHRHHHQQQQHQHRYSSLRPDNGNDDDDDDDDY